MKTILCILALLPFTVFGQRADTMKGNNWKIIPEGFADAGVVNELWVISKPINHGYSSFTYRGPGFYFGGGLKTKTSPLHPIGYCLNIDYLQYKMGKSLGENEQASTSYSFARFSPAVTVLLKQTAAINFYGAVVAGILAPVKNNEHSYYQLGARVSAEYKAYEIAAAFNYGTGKSSPSADITTKGWHEQMFTLGIACYPYRLLPRHVHSANVLKAGKK